MDETPLHPSYPSDTRLAPFAFRAESEAAPLVSHVNLICTTPTNEISPLMADAALLCVWNGHCAEFTQNIVALL